MRVVSIDFEQMSASCQYQRELNGERHCIKSTKDLGLCVPLNCDFCKSALRNIWKDLKDEIKEIHPSGTCKGQSF